MKSITDIRTLNKLNEIWIHWLTPCSHCGNLDGGFTITEIHKGAGTYMATCRCKKCCKMNKFELSDNGQIKDIIENHMEEKVIWECDEFHIKETAADYYIEFKTDKALIELDSLSDYPKSKAIGVTVIKSETTAR